ncbi:helix-turn-helix domain-containing protein [Inediibacterium massiliense]|uniref:helix-turn-helix domain-containing protein n=1 Tax=Inediibacterium massiliense TaxID=1658111 RepID=UPI0006B60AAF|nr:helix-turn-helix transcriptional regulator [Inediibacterium massiliense]
MAKYTNFGICLNELLNITNIKVRQLANAINVDPSLISKWKTGQRKIVTHSNYLKNISNYLSEHIHNEYQKNDIIHIANQFKFYMDVENFNGMNNYIYELLLGLLQDYKKNNVMNSDFHEAQEKSFYDLNYMSNFELIKGEENIINTGMALLKSIPEKPYHIKEPIVITFFTEFKCNSYLEKVYSQWNDVLLEVQKKGWSIYKVVNINNNAERNKKIINELLNNIFSEKYNLYFWNKYDIVLQYREIMFIPNTGTLIVFFNRKSKKMDNAFLIKDIHALEVFQDYLSLNNKYLSSLIIDKVKFTSPNILENFTVYENLNGNRFIYNWCFHSISIPEELYDKIFLLYNKTIKEKELSLFIEKQKNVKKDFHIQIQSYKFIEIYSKDFIENLVKTSKEPGAYLNSYDVYILLKNIIYMLENYENYNIALINDQEKSIFDDFSWMIKESNVVLIHNFHQPIEENEKVCISITEPTMVHYVTNCFKEMLNEIAPFNKEKKNVISWFKIQMKYL